MIPGVRGLSAGAWDRLLEPRDPPFLEHRFLASLEEAGTLEDAAGWAPSIVVLRRGSELIAAAPAYTKDNSEGEFVFDWGWADAAIRSGIPYYPKLLVGVPFTPIMGRRLLTAPGEDRTELMKLLGEALVALAEERGLSSVHVNFARDEEIAALDGAGFFAREGIQYHWWRGSDRTFDDYLARFKSKRRNQLTRERRELRTQGVRIEVLSGDALTREVMDAAFELYARTVDKFYWGRRYLNRRVFELWRERMSDRLDFVIARDDAAVGGILAGALNFRGRDRLYGRYWGAYEDRRHLHFNVCYYAGIDRCLELGLDVFEPGAGGEHKLARGFTPTITRSAHWIADERLRDAVVRHVRLETLEVRRRKDLMSSSMGLRSS